VAKVVAEDLSLLQQGQVKPTQGDTRCIVFGHIIRLAVWSLRIGWKADRVTQARITEVERWVRHFGGAETVIKELGTKYTSAAPNQHCHLAEAGAAYRVHKDEISF